MAALTRAVYREGRACVWCCVCGYVAGGAAGRTAEVSGGLPGEGACGSRDLRMYSQPSLWSTHCTSSTFRVTYR
jgi:hypothetical protein